jgi:hypothetical protein
VFARQSKAISPPGPSFFSLSLSCVLVFVLLCGARVCSVSCLVAVPSRTHAKLAVDSLRTSCVRYGVALTNVASAYDRSLLIQVLLSCYRATGRVLNFLERLVQDEFDNKSKSYQTETILRGGVSVTTRYVTAYVRLVGGDYLREVLSDLVNQIIDGRSCACPPTRKMRTHSRTPLNCLSNPISAALSLSLSCAVNLSFSAARVLSFCATLLARWWCFFLFFFLSFFLSFFSFLFSFFLFSLSLLILILDLTVLTHTEDQDLDLEVNRQQLSTQYCADLEEELEDHLAENQIRLQAIAQVGCEAACKGLVCGLYLLNSLELS